MGTADKAISRRKLADLQRNLARVDLAAGKRSLAEMCDRYLETVQNQRQTAVRSKPETSARLKAGFPGGADIVLAKVEPSKVSAWLAGYDFGAASCNLYLEFILAVFSLAVGDRLVPESPVARTGRSGAPGQIRQTQSFDDFRAIVANIRAQRFNADARDSGDFVVPLYPQLRPLLELLRQERGGEPPNDEAVFRIKDARQAAGSVQPLPKVCRSPTAWPCAKPARKRGCVGCS